MAVQIGSAYGTIEIGTSGAIQSVQSLSSTLRSIGTTMTAAISAPLRGAAAVALKSAGDFEQSMNIMQQVSKATDEQMAQMQSAALQWGAETVFSAGEVADGMLEMSKAGFEVDDVMSAMPGVMNLAAAANMDLASAGEITANVINAFGLESSKATEIADLLAATANSSSLEITDLGYSFQMASAVAHQFGLSADELAASLAIMGDQGLKGSDAGTSFKTMLMRLMSPTDKAKDVLDELGVSVFDSAGAMRAYPDIMADLQQALYGTTEAMVTTGGRTKEQEAEMRRYAKMIQSTKQKLADYANGVAGVRQSEAKKAQTIDQLNRELVAQEAAYNKLAGIQGTTAAVARTLSEEERAAAMNILFGSDAIRAANILLPEFASKYQEASAAVNEQGAAADVAGARMKGFNGAIEYLKGSIDSFLIGTALPFLDSFGGLVRAAADGITAFGGLSQPVKNAALAFAAVLAAIGPTLLVISGLNKAWGMFKVALLAVKAALLSVSWPVWAIVAAIAVLGAAWAYNWGGIREKTQAVIDYLRPGFAELLGWISSAMQGDFGPLKAGLQGALQKVNATIQAFKWSDFVASLNDWGTYIQGLVWGTVLPVLVDWGTYIQSLVWGTILPTLTDWGTYIAALPWGTYIATLTSWADFITSLDWTKIITTAIDWAMWIPALSWTAIITAIEWSVYIGVLAWSAFVSALDWATAVGSGIDWSVFISALSWSNIVAAIDWATYIAAFAWESFITKLEWTGAITKLENWGTFIASVDWSGYISSLVWSTIFPALTDWGTYIASLDWTQIITTAIDWAMWVPALSWTAFVTALAWTGYIVGVSLLKFVSMLTWDNFVAAIDWAVWLAKLAWSTYIKAVEWSAWIFGLMWSSFVSHLEWMDFVVDLSGWGDFVPPLTWSSFVASVDLASFIPDFGSWYDYIKAYFSSSEPATGNAGGTSYAFGQRSALNERGRELVSIPSDQAILPPGSRVYTNGQSNRMLAGAGDGGIVINLNGTVINSDRDIHSLANELGSLLKRKR